MLPSKLLLDNDSFFTEAARMLSQGYNVTIKAKGDSMFPFIRDGRDDVVLGKPDTMEVGDIVLAHIPGKGYVLHRIYRMGGNGLTLMGDGNLHGTERCRKGDVLGKATLVLRGGRAVECASLAERRRATLWRWLLPVRRYLLFICRLRRKRGSAC